MDLPSVFAWGAARCALLVLPVLLLGTGCYMNGMGCQPGDDTETCCLKEHPGAWERCTGKPGPTPKGPTKPDQPKPKSQPKPKPKPKNQPEPEKSPQPFAPPIPTEEQKTEWRDRCLEHYVRCKHTEKGEEWGRVFDESQCKACWELCKRTGVWPDETNGKPCPGG
jgi:hypothetical protein